MAGIYSILLIGLKAPQESFVLSHFAQSGHRVVAAKDVAEAKEKLKAQQMGFVYLQPSSNDRAVDELKEAGRDLASLPIVLLCAQSREGLILDAWLAGASDVLFLPLTPQSLDVSLQRAARQFPLRGIDAPPVPARFFYLDETGKECWASILPPRFTIGRSSGNNLILSHMGISRSHAEVLIQNGEHLAARPRQQARDLSERRPGRTSQTDEWRPGPTWRVPRESALFSTREISFNRFWASPTARL